MWRHVAFWGASAAAFGGGVYAATALTRKPRETQPGETNSGTTPRDQARGIFDKWAHMYDSKVEMDERMFLISRLRKQLVRRAKGDVLEVGAGSGRNQEYYDESVRLTLIDQSEKMLEQAKKKTTKAQVLKIEAVDAHKLPYPDKSFDTVVDTFGLCTFEQPAQVLKEMQRVCKDDGQILLLEHGKSNYDWLTKYLDNGAHDHAKKWGCWWNRDIDAIVRASGMDIVQESRHHLGTNYVIIGKPAPAAKHQPTQQ